MNVEKLNREKGNGMAQRSSSRTIAWIVLVVAAAACFWVAENTRDIRTLRADLRATNDELDRLSTSAPAAMSKTAFDTMRADIATLQRQVARLQDKLAPTGTTGEETADGSAEIAEALSRTTSSPTDE